MILGVTDNQKAQYGDLFLAVSGVYSPMPAIVCWFNGNCGLVCSTIIIIHTDHLSVAGHLRHSVETGWQIGLGNLGGFVAIFTFLSQSSSFKNGYAVCVGFICLSFFPNVMYFTGPVLENRRRDNSNEDATIPESEKQRMGDLNPDYRYML